MLMLGMMALFFLCLYVLWAIESFEEFFKAAGWLIFSTKLVHHCIGSRRNMKELTKNTYLQLWLKTVTRHFYVWQYCGGWVDIYVKLLPGLYIKIEAQWDA